MKNDLDEIDLTDDEVDKIVKKIIHQHREKIHAAMLDSEVRERVFRELQSRCSRGIATKLYDEIFTD